MPLEEEREGFVTVRGASCVVGASEGHSLTHRVTAAEKAPAARGVPVVVVQAALAVGPVKVVGAVATVASVSRGSIQLRIEVALCTLAIAVTS